MQRKEELAYPYVLTHKPCGLALMMEVDTNNQEALGKALGRFPIGYIFSEKNIYFVDLIAGKCTSYSVGEEKFSKLMETLKLEGHYDELKEIYNEDKNINCKRYELEMSDKNLEEVAKVTNEKIPALNFNDILMDLSRIPCSYENWQAYLGDKKRFSDDMLYHFFLKVNVNGIIDAAQGHPASHDIPAEILAAAKIKIAEMRSDGITIPEGACNDKAYLFTILEAYARVRAQGPEYKTIASSLISSVCAGLSKTEKLDYCELYKKFITSGYDLNQFDVFLKSTIPKPEKGGKVGFFTSPRVESMFSKKKTILQGFIKAVHDCTRNRGNELTKGQASQSTIQEGKASVRPGFMGN